MRDDRQPGELTRSYVEGIIDAMSEILEVPRPIAVRALAVTCEAVLRQKPDATIAELGEALAALTRAK